MTIERLEQKYAWMRDRMARRREASLDRCRDLSEQMATELKHLTTLTVKVRQAKRRFDTDLMKLERWAAK